MIYRDHQKLVIDYFIKKKLFGLLIFHGLGSGKTILSLGIAKKLKLPIVIICPLSVKNIFKKEAKRMDLKIELYSYEFFTEVSLDSDILKGKLVIIDEAHRLRNLGRIARTIGSFTKDADHLILMSGTVFVNHPSDISALINMIDKKKTLTTNRSRFEYNYINKSIDMANDAMIYTIANRDLLLKKLKGKISYYMPKVCDNDNYPRSKQHHVKVMMSKPQLKQYQSYVSKLPKTERYLFQVGADLFISKTNTKVNAFLNRTRQISNTVEDQIDSPKLLAIMEKIKTGPSPTIVYSNFKHNGVYPLSLLLDRQDIVNTVFTGETTVEERGSLVEQYNAGKIPVLLITSAASEGLDLKKTRQIHIMEPHWNSFKIRQVIGRGIRYKSHVDLPIKKQNVTIYYWISGSPKGVYQKMADEYLYKLSIKKENLCNSFLDIFGEKRMKINSI